MDLDILPGIDSLQLGLVCGWAPAKYLEPFGHSTIARCALVNNEYLSAGIGMSAMPSVMIAHVEAVACCRLKDAAIFQDGGQRSFEDKDDVSLSAPMVGSIAGTEFHDSHTEIVCLDRS